MSEDIIVWGRRPPGATGPTIYVGSAADGTAANGIHDATDLQ